MVRNKDEKKASNVEFGNEFGDINAAKAYEIPLQSMKEKKKEKQKSKKQGQT